MDSKSVILASSAYGCGPVEHVKRWGQKKKEKRYVKVPAPRIVREYNKRMGGFDVCDQLMESYRSFYKTRKWTLIKVFIHFIDLVCCCAGCNIEIIANWIANLERILMICLVQK